MPAARRGPGGLCSPAARGGGAGAGAGAAPPLFLHRPALPGRQPRPSARRPRRSRPGITNRSSAHSTRRQRPAPRPFPPALSGRGTAGLLLGAGAAGSAVSPGVPREVVVHHISLACLSLLFPPRGPFFPSPATLPASPWPQRGARSCPRGCGVNTAAAARADEPVAAVGTASLGWAAALSLGHARAPRRQWVPYAGGHSLRGAAERGTGRARNGSRAVRAAAGPSYGGTGARPGCWHRASLAPPGGPAPRRGEGPRAASRGRRGGGAGRGGGRGHIKGPAHSPAPHRSAPPHGTERHSTAPHRTGAAGKGHCHRPSAPRVRRPHSTLCPFSPGRGAPQRGPEDRDCVLGLFSLGTGGTPRPRPARRECR